MTNSWPQGIQMSLEPRLSFLCTLYFVWWSLTKGKVSTFNQHVNVGNIILYIRNVTRMSASCSWKEGVTKFRGPGKKPTERREPKRIKANTDSAEKDNLPAYETAEALPKWRAVGEVFLSEGRKVRLLRITTCKLQKPGQIIRWTDRIASKQVVRLVKRRRKLIPTNRWISEPMTRSAK